MSGTDKRGRATESEVKREREREGKEDKRTAKIYTRKKAPTLGSNELEEEESRLVGNGVVKRVTKGNRK